MTPITAHGVVREGQIVITDPGVVLPEGINVVVTVLAADPAPTNDRWLPLIAAAGKDLIDPDVYRELRAASLI